MTALSGGLILLASLPSLADPPANDPFVGGVMIGPLPFSDARNTDQATTQTAEPQPSCGHVAGTVWYRLRPASDIRVVAETTRSGFDTVLAVWTGSSLSNLNEVDCNDDTPEWLDSRVILEATGGRTYHFQVGGLDERTGEMRFSVRPFDSGAVAGQVSAGSSGAQGVCVDSYDPATGEWMRSAETDPQGNFVIDELPPSDYLLQIADCTTPARYRAEWYRDAETREEATPIAVNGGRTAVANADVALLAPSDAAPTPPPEAAPQPAAPGRKEVTLSAGRKKVRRGKKVTLIAAVSPCSGHEGDSIELRRNGRTIETASSNRGCTARFRLKIRRRSVFRASSPQQDADHLAGTSNPVRVKVKRRR
ncbi:MAG: hypothetical protein ACRDJP_14100 [Actinomycetota bacterium]